MPRLPRVSSFWRNVFHKQRVERDLDEEVRAYLDQLTDEKIQSGLSPQEARRTARIELGGVEQVKEQVREVRSGAFLETLVKDARLGFRMLRKNPGFTAVAVLTLALGIGPNTALFSLINGVLLNPLRYPEPEQLVALYRGTPDMGYSPVSYPNFLDWVRDNHSFSLLAGYRPDNFNLTGMGEAERVPAEMISASFFPLLGVHPILGRAFLPEEDQVGARPVVLISEGLWKGKLGSSPDVVGKALTLNGTSYTIVGVIPADFSYASGNFHKSEVYVPIGQWNDSTFRDRRAPMDMNVVGRLKAGVTFEQAKADMEALGWHLAEEYPDANKGTGIALTPLKQSIVGESQPVLFLLLAAVGFVLLIACVNVANLLLVRSTARTREFAVRTALGASRGQIVRQLLTESTLLALAGGSLGLLLASRGTQAALKVLPQALPRAEEAHFDGRVLLFTLAASLLAGILFGLAPALKTSRPDLDETLKEGGRGTSGARHRTQNVFVVVETALALVLLVGAGLMTRSLAKLWSVDPGFDPRNVLTFDLSFPSTIESPSVIRATWRRLQNSLSTVPGTEAASLRAGAVPMGMGNDIPFWLEGQPKPLGQSEMKSTLLYVVQPGYLKVMRIPVERGRFFTPQDNEGSPSVIVIDDWFSRLYFSGQDPIGKRINFDVLNIKAEIVGVVGHVKQSGLDEGAPPPECYLPISQLPDKIMPLVAGGVGAAVRIAGPPLAEANSIRRAVEQINSLLVIYNTQTMEGMIAGSLAGRRFLMILLGIFAALALVMSCVGIYGVVSHVVGQRTHEIGIRLALGAERRDVLRMVLTEGAKMALLGVATGLVAAFVLTRLMADMLFGISAHDPITFAGVAGLLVLVALAACYMPARRATNVDPMVVLRYE